MDLKAKSQIKKILLEVATDLEEGKYDALSQLVGYLNTGDPGYISTYRGAREKIISLDRYQIIEILLKEFIDL